MDVIQGFEETALDKINMPTLAAFIPILNDHKAEIEKIERREFKYGQRSRHYLDVYYPPATSALATASGKLPVLFFVYGGGYNTGARRLPAPYEMGYRALGAFFAARGFLVVIPDYRLVPEVRFPSASEDLRDALLWVGGHAEEIAGAVTVTETTGACGAGAGALLDPGCVFMLAHSAGAAHTLGMHLCGPVRASWVGRAAELGLRVRGVVLSGSPWYFSVRGETFVTTGPVKFYFGGEAAQKEREPRALWAAFGEEEVRGLPDVMLMQAEREPGWLREETKGVMEEEMRAKLEKAGRVLDATYIAAGHNHVSVNWALGTGDERGEKWGYDVVAWIKARMA